MKNYIVSDIRWANTKDLNLPFWTNWNKENPLPSNFWQRIWEYPYLCSRIPSSSKSLDIGGTYPFILFSNFPNAISIDCRDLNNLDHPLHLGKWPKDKLVVCDATNIPFGDNSFDHVFSISTIEEIPDLFAAIKEMIRLARHRVVITVDVSDKLGMPRYRMRELEDFLKTRIPPLPPDSLNSTSPILKKFGQQRNKEYKHIRVLGITLDAYDTPKSVGILIPHWESGFFLKLCLEAIQKNRNKNLTEKAYVLDDASSDGSFEKTRELFKNDKNIEFHRFERPNRDYDADVGLLLDYGLKLVNEQYVVAIDADLFPLSQDWITFPIWLIEMYNCSSVGLDTGLSTNYLSKDKSQSWCQPPEGYLPSGGLYDNEWFTCTNNLYRVMPTALAKVVSESIGYTRNNLISPPEKSILYKIYIKLQNYRRKYNSRYPYLPGGCDNGVAANHFIDINRLGPKFNIPLTSYIGLTSHDGAFGQNISGLAFHFALSTRALSRLRREVNETGESFSYWIKKLQKVQDLDNKIIKEMIEASTHFQPGGYDFSIPVSWYEKEYVYIQKLLSEYRKQT